MKNAVKIFCVCILVCAFAFMFVFSAFLPRTTESNYDILKKYPIFSTESLLSGKYLNEFKDYFADTIHLRDNFVDFEALIRDLYGINDEDGTIIETGPNEDADDTTSSDSNVSSAPDTSSKEESSTDSSNESSEAPDDSSSDTSVDFSEDLSDTPSKDTSVETPDSSDTSEESNDTVDKFQVQEIESRLIILGTRIFEIYGGDRANSDGKFDIELYAETLNEFAEKIGPSVNVYSMVIPKACAYYLQQADSDKYNKYLNKDRDDINKISELLSDNVIDVNIYNALGRHANEDIYFRTDHHWTALGAYYGCEVFAEKAGIVIDDISEFTVTERAGFLGSLYGSSNGSTVLLNNPEIFKTYYPNTDYTATYFNPKDLESNMREHEEGFFWNKSDNQKSNWYSTFINGDSYSVKAVSNECKNGRKLLIVKDSYGNALAPFLMEGFEEIYIVDSRQYEITLTETINKYGITDVLFAECTFSAASNGYVNNLKELCK
ncbi:MAG: hypothetical protein IKU23_06305, partial [Clostridia bacterium]|nr:hypothetical protein [Clostridia bacterium]